VDATSRRLRVVDEGARPFPVAGRWAVVIGVSEYKDPRLNLEYAADDARDLAALISTPTGGGFPPERVRLLVDKDATTREVTRALRSFLTKPAPEDLALIFLACHGGPDPRRPGRLYLFTHDTEIDDIAGTAVPMDEIQSALRDSLLAERVVVIADTCHSGGLGGRGNRGAATAEATNTYLAQLAATKPGVALLTSCEAAESSLEDARWGGGHGVFTWHLLEGMRGAADGFGRARDGIVGVGELFDYVRDRVLAETNGQQHPSIGSTPFDRDLPMAVTAGAESRHHLELARSLNALGWLTDDPAAFRCAVREAREAAQLTDLGGGAGGEVSLVCAEAHLAVGDATAARRALDENDDLSWAPETGLIRGVVLAECGEAERASTAFTEFAEAQPQHEEAGWARQYSEALSRSRASSRYALLLGAGTFRTTPAINLRGAANDARDLADLLKSRCGFDGAKTRVLVGAKATRASVLSAFQRLADSTGPHDTVVVSFSGHATGESPDDPYLVTADWTAEEPAAITARELVEALSRISGQSKVLVLDTGLRAARELLSTLPGWTTIGVRGQALDVSVSGRYNGALTRALIEAWPERANTTCAELAQRVEAWLHQREFDMAPDVLGDPSTVPAAPGFAAAQLWWLARRGSIADIDSLEWLTRNPALRADPRGQWSLGHLLLEKDDVGSAGPLLRLARASLGHHTPALELDWARYNIAAGSLDEARSTLESLRPGADAPDELVVNARAAVQALAHCRTKALLVGIDTYATPTETIRGAELDATSWAESLARSGLAEADTTLLLGPNATRERILSEFDTLAEHGRDQLAVFVFAGLGSWTAEGRASVLSWDARLPGVGDIALDELARRAGASPNLVAILDAGGGVLGSEPMTPGGPETGARTAASEGRTQAGPATAPAAVAAPPTIGAVTLTPLTPARSRSRGLEVLDKKSGHSRGRFSSALEGALAPRRVRSSSPAVTYTSLAGRRALQGSVRVTGVAAGEAVLQHRTARQTALRAIREFELQAVHQCIALASASRDREATRNQRDPWTELELGLSFAALGDEEEAKTYLRRARNLHGERPSHTSDDDAWFMWACHHLGRLLYQTGGDFNEAVTNLRAASELAPDEARTTFHLAHAIRTLVERESLVDVATLLQRYLDLGAPLGRVADTQELLVRITRTTGPQPPPAAGVPLA
jgi:uncharacterized caspase-like protein/tetratricopeptide (TPR) repeat protein